MGLRQGSCGRGVVSVAMLVALVAGEANAGGPDPWGEAFPAQDSLALSAAQGIGAINEASLGYLGVVLSQDAGSPRFKEAKAWLDGASRASARAEIAGAEPAARKIFAEREALEAALREAKENAAAKADAEAGLARHRAEHAALEGRVEARAAVLKSEALAGKGRGLRLVAAAREQKMAGLLRNAGIAAGLYLIVDGGARLGLALTGKAPGVSPVINASLGFARKVAPSTLNPAHEAEPSIDVK